MHVLLWLTFYINVIPGVNSINSSSAVLARPISETISPDRVKRSLASTPTLYIFGPSIRRCRRVRLFDVGWQTTLNPQKRDKYTLMYDWMDYLNHSQGLHIRHKLNTGKEKKIGPYPVDGYDTNTNTVYQFHGCYWHGHECWMTKNVKDQKWRETRQSKYDKTVKTTTLIQTQRYKVVEKWEYHFRNEIRRNDKLKTFCDSRKPPTPQRSVTENEILESVASGRLFGMVECDIRVPDKWPSYFQHPTMTPYEYFEEMSPLFCTTDLISEHMQDHIQRFELSEKPRRLLVGGMPGRQMLIATPLLKRYLEHCMVVTKIYQVVEFTPHLYK